MLVVKDPYVDSDVEERGNLPLLEQKSKPFQGKTPLNANRFMFLHCVLESTNKIISVLEIHSRLQMTFIYLTNCEISSIDWLKS